MKKVPGERNLYRDPKSLLYFLRSQQGGVNTFIALETTRKEQAIKNAEEFRGNQFRKRHEIPEKTDSGPSPLLGPLLDQYRAAGYPDMRQKARDKDSSYFKDQEDTMLKQFFGQRYESELRPALLNEYHRWRKNPERLKAGAIGDRITDLELTCLSNMLN